MSNQQPQKCSKEAKFYLGLGLTVYIMGCSLWKVIKAFKES